MNARYIKQEKAFDFLEKGMKKHPSINGWFQKKILRTIKDNIDAVDVISNKFKLAVKFYDLFIKYNDLDSKDDVKTDNEYYRNFNRLKKFSLIHPQSAGFFPKNLKLVSINPNHSTLISEQFSSLDMYTEQVDYVRNQLIDSDKYSYLFLYIYFRFFHIVTFTHRQLAEIEMDDIIVISEKKAILILYDQLLNTVNISREERFYKILLLDESVSKFLFLLKKTGKLFEKHQQYEEHSQKFRKKRLPRLKINTIETAKRNYYLFTQSPIELTVKGKMIPTVSISLAEIEKLFPGKVPERLMYIERARINNVLTRPKSAKKEQNKSSLSIYDMESLLALLRVKESDNDINTKIDDAIQEIELLKSINISLHNSMIFEYTELLLSLVQKKRIRLSTFKNYMWLLNKHLFMMVEDLSNIKYEEIQKIINRLDRDEYKKSSVIKVRSRIGNFFRFHQRKGIAIPFQTMFYPKSMLLKSEVDVILEEIKKAYLLEKKVKRIGKNHEYQILQRQTIFLIVFYTGLRRNEIRTRLCKDIYLYDTTVYVDVNSKGLRKLGLRLKTKNSKRRVEAIIENESHRNIIKTFISLRNYSEKLTEFLFLEQSKNGQLLNKAVNQSVIDGISLIIKKTTRRYCTFHSLRHSFASYRFKELLKKQNNFPYAVLELSIMLGHETPDVTLSSYIHADLMELVD